MRGTMPGAGIARRLPGGRCPNIRPGNALGNMPSLERRKRDAFAAGRNAPDGSSPGAPHGMPIQGARPDYRLSSMARFSISSDVVTTLLLAWKPRWVMIMSTISDAMSTLDCSIL